MSNVRRKGMTPVFTAKFTTTVSIALVLFVLGIVMLVALAGRGLSSLVKETQSVSLVVAENMEAAVVQQWQTRLQQKPYVRQVRFISKEDIKKDLVEYLGRDPEEVLGYNPASDCFDVHLKSEYVNADSLQMIEADLKGMQMIKNVMFNADDLKWIDVNISKVSTGLLVIAGLLMLISFALIQNTIRLNIYSRRFIINTMRLVGATNAFIRRPFVCGMMGAGVIAALLANLAIAGLVYYFSIEYPEIESVIKVSDLVITTALVFVLGISLSIMATIFAVNRYLRMKTDNYYRV